MIMMNGILVACNDLDLRIHHRSQMEAAGLRQILELLRAFDHAPLNRLMQIFQQTLDEDEKKLRERLDGVSTKDGFYPSNPHTTNTSAHGTQDRSSANPQPRQSNGIPHSQKGEEEPIHLSEKQLQKEWTHGETLNLMKGCGKVRHSITVRPYTYSLPEGSPF